MALAITFEAVLLVATRKSVQHLTSGLYTTQLRYRQTKQIMYN